MAFKCDHCLNMYSRVYIDGATPAGVGAAQLCYDCFVAAKGREPQREEQLYEFTGARD